MHCKVHDTVARISDHVIIGVESNPLVALLRSAPVQCVPIPAPLPRFGYLCPADRAFLLSCSPYRAILPFADLFTNSHFHFPFCPIVSTSSTSWDSIASRMAASQRAAAEAQVSGSSFVPFLIQFWFDFSCNCPLFLSFCPCAISHDTRFAT